MPSLTDVPITIDLLRGVAELEPTTRGQRPHRLPGWARAQCADPQFVLAESQPAGVRLAFRTRSTAVELDVVRTRLTYKGLAPRPDGVYDLLIDGRLARQDSATGGDLVVMDMATRSAETLPGPVCTVRFADLPDTMKTVEIWLPHNELTELVALRTDQPVEPAPSQRPIWLHHGSSISSGSNALHPTGTWPGVAAAITGLDLVNLGLSGSALLDPFVARTLRDAPGDLISLEIGINLVNADLMRLRAFGPAVHGFLDTIRDGHPSTPLVVLSPIHCPIHEGTPGPGVAEFTDGVMTFAAGGDPADTAAGKLTLRTIRTELAGIVAQRSADDPNLHYLDGQDLYGPDDYAQLPLADNLHPGPPAHRLIGERFAAAAAAGLTT